MSITSIYNQALTILGKPGVSAPNDPGARQIKSVYENVRDRLLRSYLWKFAKKDYVLNPLSETPDFGFSFKFKTPQDCLRILESDKTPKYERKGADIFSDQSVFRLTCICVVDESLFTPDFESILAYDLAIETCFAYTSDLSLKANLMAQRKAMMTEIKRVDATEASSAVIGISGTWGER